MKKTSPRFTVVPIRNFTTGTECKYSALYLARKVSAFLLYLLILLLYNNRAINNNFLKKVYASGRGCKDTDKPFG